MKHALIVLGLLSGFLFLARGTVYSGPYVYDEADYLYAASLGPVSNALDSPTLSMSEFIRLGLGRGKDPNQKSSLSDAVRKNNDVVFYRHWHGPLVFYWLMPLRAMGCTEGAMRASMLVFPLLTLIVTYFGSLWVLPAAVKEAGAVLAAVLVSWNFAAVKPSEVAPHQLFVLTFVSSLMLLAKATDSGERKFWYASVLAAAFAFLTLEVAIVLVFTLVWCAWRERKRWRLDWPFAGKSVALFAAPVVILWPGTIFKLSFAKAYFFLVYLSVFRKAPWGEVSLLDTWRFRLSTAPVDWLLFLFGVIALFAWREMEPRRAALPFLIFGGVMLLTVLRVASNSPRYVLPFMPAFDIFAAWMTAGFLARLRPAMRNVAVGVLCATIGAVAWLNLRAFPLRPQPRPRAVLAAIREAHLDDKRLLAPQTDVPVLHYYFPRTDLEGYWEPAPPEGGKFDAVLYPGFPVRLERR